MPRVAKPTEAGFTKTVLQFAKLHGWKVHHGRPALTAKGWRTPVMGDVGFPDIVLARAGRVLFAELKVGKNKPTHEQALWLAACGGVVWRPEMWDTISATLRG